MYEELKEMLILHEGLRLKPYRCSEGKLTIGVGRNLDDNGISKDEAMSMLMHDISRAIGDLSNYAWFHALDNVRQDAMIDMMFNLGAQRFAGFKKMIAAMEVCDYQEAAKEMLDSRYARQVGERADRLAEMVRTGKRPQLT